MYLPVSADAGKPSRPMNGCATRSRRRTPPSQNPKTKPFIRGALPTPGDALGGAYPAEPDPQTKALHRRLLAGPRKRAEPSMQPLVGRQSEWKRLVSAWQRAKVGESH